MPAMTSLFTGLYPIEHGVNQAGSVLPLGVSTLVGRLKGLGYETASFTAVPWIGLSTRLQFDTHKLVDRLFDKPDLRWWHLGVEKLYAWVRAKKDKGAARINEEVKRWLAGLSAPDRPFFLYLHYLEPHAPYWPPTQYHDFVPSDTHADRELQRLADIELAYLAGQVELSRRDLEAIRGLYDSSIYYLDERIGELLDMLSARFALDEMLIIVTADHGENLGEHGLLGHQHCLYDSLLRVPLIVRYPARFPAGVRIPSVVQTIDLMATVADVLGVNETWQPGASSWNSLVPNSLTESAVEERAYAQYLCPLVERFQRWYPGFDSSIYERRYWSIRTAARKLIRDDLGSIELYNYRDDPGEIINLAAQESAEAERLDLELTAWLKRVDRLAGEPGNDLDLVTLERLRGLGYL
jgi:arylsulfatase A-like enzyme